MDYLLILLTFPIRTAESCIISLGDETRITIRRDHVTPWAALVRLDLAENRRTTVKFRDLVVGSGEFVSARRCRAIG
jgi:hypothetical protein